jgi:excisionase family DNA binding protein
VKIETTKPCFKIFLDIQTAAGFAGYSQEHFRRLIREDPEIPTTKIGGKLRVRGQDLQKWLAKRKVSQL